MTYGWDDDEKDRPSHEQSAFWQANHDNEHSSGGGGGGSSESGARRGSFGGGSSGGGSSGGGSSGGAGGEYTPPALQRSKLSAPRQRTSNIRARLAAGMTQQREAFSAKGAQQQAQGTPTTLRNRRGRGVEAMRSRWASDGESASLQSRWGRGGEPAAGRERTATEPARSKQADGQEMERAMNALRESLRDPLRAKVRAQHSEAVNRLTDEQKRIMTLLDKLPEDFPAADWDTMNPYRQLDVMKHSGLTRTEQWEMLNAKPSVRTVSQIRDLLDNGYSYGLTGETTAQAAARLLELGNERTGAENHAFFLGSDSLQESFIRQLRQNEIGS